MTTSKSVKSPSRDSDDARMNSLYAPFRLKSVNPVDWESKMNFWCDSISRLCLEKKNPTFTIDDLKTEFKRKNKSPACLDTVIEHLLSSKRASTIEQIFQNGSDGWMLWSTKQLLRPVSWASKALLSQFLPSKPVIDSSSLIVHVECLKKQALSLIANTSEENRIGNISEIKKIADVDDDVFDLLMKWLLSEKLATISTDGQIYKLSGSCSNKVTPLTESEICLCRIAQTAKQLHHTMEDLEEKIETARNTAKSYITKKNKSLAMNQLRQKKAYENRLEKISNKHDSLIHISETIKQTHVDSQVFDILKNSLTTLKKTTQEKGLNEDSVIDTMDDVKQVLDEIAEVQSILAQPIGTQYDMDELEAELRDLNSDADVGNDDGGMTKPESDLKLPEAPKEDEEKKFLDEMEKNIKGLTEKVLIANT